VPLFPPVRSVSPATCSAVARRGKRRSRSDRLGIEGRDCSPGSSDAADSEQGSLVRRSASVRDLTVQRPQLQDFAGNPLRPNLRTLRHIARSNSGRPNSTSGRKRLRARSAVATASAASSTSTTEPPYYRAARMSGDTNNGALQARTVRRRRPACGTTSGYVGRRHGFRELAAPSGFVRGFPCGISAGCDGSRRSFAP
jgi:hypothetical protein